MANCVVIKNSSTNTTSISTTTTTTTKADNKILNKTINSSNDLKNSIEINFKETFGFNDFFDSFKSDEKNFNKSTKLINLSKENMQSHSIDEKNLNENLICLLTNELINTNLTKINSDKILTENLLKNLKKIKQLNKLGFCDLESNDSQFENLNKSFPFDFDQSNCFKNLDNFFIKKDCCADEKLRLRKELQKYSKNTLMFVGLQRVALDLMGIKQWRKVFSEINCLETNDNEIEDWKPNEICLLCDSNQNLNSDKLNTFKNNFKNSLLNFSTEMTKNKPIMTTILTNNNSIIKDSESKHLNSTNLKTLISNMADQNENLDETETKKETSKHSTDCQLKSLTSLYENKTQCSSIVGDESASADFDNSSVKSETLSNESNVLSVQNQSNMTIGDQKFQLTSLANLLTSKTFNFNSSQEDNKISNNFDSDNQMNVSQFEQPLDLSLPSRKNTDFTNCNSVLSSVYNNETSLSGKLKKPKIEGSKKRSYTEEELEKALEDIQSGKLGTRRAAAIYKIPRSTLRNKVHKLNNADKNLKIASNQTFFDKKQSNSSLKMLVNLTPKNNLTNDNNDNQEIQQSTSELLTANDSLRELLKKNKNSKTIESSATNKNYTNLEFLQNLQQRFELQQVLNNLTAQAQTYSQFNNLINPSLANENPAMRFLNQQQNLDNIGMNYNNSTLSNLIAFLNLHLQLLKHQEINKQNGDNLEDQMYSENDLQSNSLIGLTNENQNTDSETNVNNVNLLNESINSVASSNSYNSSALEMDFHEDESRSSNEKNSKSISKTNTDIEKVIETLQGNNTEDSNTQSSTLDEKPKLENENINKLQQNNLPVNLNLNESFNSNNSLNLVNNSFLLNTLTNSFNTISNLANPLNLNQLNLASLTNNLGGFNNLSIGSLSSQCANQNVDSILNNTLNKNGQTKSLVEDLDLSFLPMNLQNINSDASTNNFLNNTTNINDFNSNPSNQNSAIVDPNRKRPKRGRYRNYNKSDLDRAVKAVQKGEMSVHRAGTLYGVPHSTLEYKVKERHLLRPKKRLQKLQSTIESNTNLDEDPLNKSANFKQTNSTSFSENDTNINAAATLKNALRGKFKPFDQQFDNSIKMTSLNSLLQQPYVPTSSSNKNIPKQKNLDNQNFLNSSVDNVANSDLIKKLQKNVKEEDYSSQFF